MKTKDLIIKHYINMTKNTNKKYRIKRSELTYLWHSNYWDGPLSGLCLYKEEKIWFHILKDGHVHRKYGLYRLTPEQLISEEYWHEQFCIHVGRHSNYVDGKKDYTAKCNPQEMWSAFYGPYGEKHTKLDLSKSEMIGYYVV